MGKKIKPFATIANDEPTAEPQAVASEGAEAMARRIARFKKKKAKIQEKAQKLGRHDALSAVLGDCPDAHQGAQTHPRGVAPIRRLRGNVYILPATDLRTALRKVGLGEEVLEAAYSEDEQVHKQNLLKLALPYVGKFSDDGIARDRLRAMVQGHTKHGPHVSIGSEAPDVLLQGLVHAFDGDPHAAHTAWRKMTRWEEEMEDRIKQAAFDDHRWHPDDGLDKYVRPRVKWYPPPKTPPNLDDLVTKRRSASVPPPRTITPDRGVRLPLIHKVPVASPAPATTPPAALYYNTAGGYLEESPEPTPTPEGARARHAEMATFLKRKTEEKWSNEPAPRGPNQRFDFNKLCSYVRHNRYRDLEEEIANGAPPDLSDDAGNTLLIISAQNGQKRIAKLLLRNGADLNAENFRGNTALHFAHAYGFDDLFDYLISKGANDAVLNDEGLHCYQGIGKDQRPQALMGRRL